MLSKTLALYPGLSHWKGPGYQLGESFGHQPKDKGPGYQLGESFGHQPKDKSSLNSYTSTSLYLMFIQITHSLYVCRIRLGA